MAGGKPSQSDLAAWDEASKAAAAAEASAKPAPEFWDKASRPKKAGRTPMKRWKKLALFGGGGFLLLVVVLLLLAPTLVGAMAPGIVASKAAAQIKGPVSIGRASLSWTGSQHLGPIILIDPTRPAGNNQVASLDVEIDRGLLGLMPVAFGGAMDLGEIKVSGSAKVVRYADGTTSLDHALAPVAPAPRQPAPAPGAEPARLPRGTRATVIIDALDLTYTDEKSPESSAAVHALKGEASIDSTDSGSSARVKLTARAAGGATGADGTVKIDAKVDQLADAGGAIRPDQAKVDATVDIGALPTGLIDAFSGMGGRLAAGLGPTVGARIGAKGSLKSGSATVNVTSQGATADGEFAITDSVLTTATPLVAKVTGAAVRALTDVDATLTASGAGTLTTAPDLSVSVDSLRVKVPAPGKKLDLAGTAASIVLQTTEVAGTLKLQGAGAPSDFRVSPIQAKVATEDLAGTVKIAASGNATIGGQPAGTLGVDLTATNVPAVLTGGAGGTQPEVQGTVALKGVATAIAQPFVGAAGLDLPRDVGPAIDAEVKVATASSGVGAGTVPPITAQITVASAKLNVKGGFELKDAAVRTAGGPLTLTADSVGGLIARFVAPDAPYRIAPGGKLAVTVSDVVVPFKDGDLARAQLDKAGAKVRSEVQGLVVTPTRPGAPGNLEVSGLSLGALAAPNAAPKIDLNGAMAYAGKPFSLSGALEVPGLYSFKPDGAVTVTPVGARPSGTIELKGVPTGIAGLFASAPPANEQGVRLVRGDTDTSLPTTQGTDSRSVVGYDAQPPAPARPAPPPPAAPAPQPGGAKPGEAPAPRLDMGRFLADAIGPTVDVKLTSGTAKGSDGVDLAIGVRAERLVSDVQASLSDKSVDVKRVGLDATVAPSTLDTVLATYAPNLTPRPQLAGTSKLTLAVDPFSIPVTHDKDGAPRPDLARAGVASLKLSLPQQTLLEKMVLKNADGTTTDLGQLGVEAIELVAKVPLAAADPGATGAQRFDVQLSGRALDGPNSQMLTIAGTASGEVGGASLRSADANFKLSDVRVTSLDRLAGKPGLISGAIGDSAAVNLDAKLRPAADGKGSQTDAELALNAPRIKMPDPVRVSLLPDRLKSDRPVQVAWTMDPAWANANLFAPPPPSGPTLPGAKPAPAQQPRLTAPVNVNVTLLKFSIAQGNGRGPLLSSIFDLGAEAALSAMELSMPDGSTIKMSGTRAALRSAPGGAVPGDTSGAQSAGVAFDMKVDEVAVTQPGGAPPPPAKGVALTGTVAGLSDALGNVSPKTAAVSASGDVPTIPTALIDALARQNGLLVDALGPTASAQIRADRFSATGGTLDMVARSDRASANVKGAVTDNVFVTSEPIKASITEVTASLAKRFVKAMPLIGTVEKKTGDDPAVITASSMRVPMDNDLKKLDGEVVIDPGVARFTAGESFGGILKALNQKSEANIGQHIEPLNMHIKQGVMTYDKWTVPLGDFKVNTRGTVDLVNEKVDVLTYLPLGALSEDVAKLFRTQAKLGGELSDTLLVPFRSRGNFGKVKTEPDMELFVKETVKNIKPEDLLKKGVEDLLKKKGGGK